MDTKVYDCFVEILREELIPAMGCTEPIAIAYAAAKARELLGREPEHVLVRCSGNVVKNVKGVIVPKSEGMRGIEIAALLGIVGGNASDTLDVLEGVTHADTLHAKELLRKGICRSELAEGVANLYLECTLEAGSDRCLVEITRYHTNITRMERNGEILFEATEEKETENDGRKAELSVRRILEFADEMDPAELRDLLLRQTECNSAIAAEGLRGDWGASVGKTILGNGMNVPVDIRAAATAAAGSDARMNGCALPVVINSGSGNQGMAISIPIEVYAEEWNVAEERKLRALALANLLSVHQKKYIGSLSAYCGAVSAATASACGIAYLYCAEHGIGADERYRILSGIITNAICTIGGMVCDGAKSSCAAKIAAAVRTALLAFDMSLAGRTFQPGEGLVFGDVEETIAAIGRMGREGMRETDVSVLNLMLANNPEQ